MIARAIISGANPILSAIRLADHRFRAAGERGPRPRRVTGAFARAGKIQKSDGDSLADASRQYAHMIG
jgi:hypothetical protein